MRLRFPGAAGTVTGFRYLVETEGGALASSWIAVLFQGLKHLRLRNRAPFPVPPASPNIFRV
jgi:metallo-beta-lactamase family protein